MLAPACLDLYRSLFLITNRAGNVTESDGVLILVFKFYQGRQMPEIILPEINTAIGNA